MKVAVNGTALAVVAQAEVAGGSMAAAVAARLAIAGHKIKCRLPGGGRVVAGLKLQLGGKGTIEAVAAFKGTLRPQQYSLALAYDRT
jgi:hypothetical protein